MMDRFSGDPGVKPASLPADEGRRLEALHDYDLLDSVAEQPLDDLVALAAQICEVPIALISFIDEERQWFKAKVGWTEGSLPRDVSFCGHAILQRDLLVVPDVLQDPRFARNPLVTGDPRVRFYAAAPLLASAGQALGTLCIFDRRPRQLSPAQQEALRALSRQVMSQLELRRQRLELLESEARLFKVFRSGPVAMSIHRWSDRTFVDVNTAFSSLLGWTREEVLGRTTTELGIVEEKAALQLRSQLEALPTLRNAEVPVKTRSGATRSVIISTELVDLRGERHAITTFVDVTARKEAEHRVRKLNRVYAVLSDINHTIVRVRDPQSMLEAACRIAVEKGRFQMAWIGLAVTPHAPLEVTAHAGATEDTLQVLKTLLGRHPPDCAFTLHAMQSGEHGVCNDIAADPGAASWREAALERNYRSMASLPLMANHVAVGTFNLYSSEAGFFDAEELRLLDELAMDISFALEVQARERERRRIEVALSESEHRFRELAENIQEVFWMTDPATKQLLYVSPAFEKIWGRTCASLWEVPSSWLDAIHADDRARVVEAMNTKQTRGDYDETYRIRRPDGRIRWIHDRAFPVRAARAGADGDALGEIIRIVGTAEDITERRQLEEQFRQAQKMDAIGQLAGGVAHDFNNILTVIQGYGSLLMMGEQTPDAADAVGQIVQAAERAANLTRQLLAFSRRQVLQPRLLDLNEIVTSLSTMLRRILGEDVRLQLNLHARPLMARADAGMLDQVLMNLVVNARDAMPGGGQMSIETTEKIFDAEEAREIGAAASGRHVCLRVTDTGSGIPAKDLPHIFEPFFTTKEPGKGTGLGLATVFGIVAQHGGSLKVDSAVGRGTVFDVFLPAAESTSSSLTEESAEPAGRGGTETILIVEDDPYVRALTRVVLERQGYHLLEAAHGAEALRIWDQHGGAVDLLLTDIVMPEGMSGRELAARLRSRNPKLKVIFTSGYSADIAGRELSERERQSFIQKPSSPRQLLETVRRCLDGAAAATPSAILDASATDTQ